VLQSCVLFFSLLNGIDPKITNAVIATESSGNPLALGSLGDSGLMQIRHVFVPESQRQLFNPCTNVMVGTRLLRQAKEKCFHQVDKTWLICYNLGTRGAKKIRFPKKFAYYSKVMGKIK
jgi:soluble lytic murein transglycosylase-like protein